MKKIKEIYKKTVKAYNNIELYFIAIFTLVVGAFIMVQVIRRKLGMQGWPWLDELSRYMLVITTFLGSSYAVKDNGHMSMDVLYNYLSVRLAYLLKSFIYLLCGSFFLYLSYYSYEWMKKLKLMRRTWETIPLNFWWVWAFVVLSLTSMSIRYFIQTGYCIKNFVKDTEEFSEMNTKEM